MCCGCKMHSNYQNRTFIMKRYVFYQNLVLSFSNCYHFNCRILGANFKPWKKWYVHI